jgi:hypothetical protein
MPLCVLSIPFFAVAAYMWLTASRLSDYYAVEFFPYGVLESGALGLVVLVVERCLVSRVLGHRVDNLGASETTGGLGSGRDVTRQ